MNIKILKNEKVKYLLAGIYNTLFGYLLFVLVFYFFYELINYIILLAFCHFIGVINNYFVYKLFVFKIKKNFNYTNSIIKFNLVYIFLYFLNVFLLFMAIEILVWNIYLAQIINITILAVVGFILNKKFSFS